MPGAEDTYRRPTPRDTIAAIATAPGRAGIGIIRISGPAVPEISRAVVGRVPDARRAVLCAFRDAAGAEIDRGLALFFPAPGSYTGEPVLELQGHGGPIVLQTVLSACLDAGARLAAPGEFTQRAFLEGKLDLAQAEAVADLIDAASREAARSALRSLSGEFSETLTRFADGLLELRALTEAMLDFPEEDVDAIHRDEASARVQALDIELLDVLARSRRGSVLRTGAHVVLAGAPNVGKSSLLNRLAGVDRAIVTPIPGTTRDALRESVEMEGVPIVLVDTAGVRPSVDPVERLGVERAREEISRADIVLLVSDTRESGAAFDAALGMGLPTQAVRVPVRNKLDLEDSRDPAALGLTAGTIAVSAMTGEGIDVLRKAILDALGWSSAGEGTFLARERHLRALERAGAHLKGAAGQVGRWELFAEELRLAHEAVGEITGGAAPDDVLGEIFSRFCLGK